MPACWLRYANDGSAVADAYDGLAAVANANDGPAAADAHDGPAVDANDGPADYAMSVGLDLGAHASTSPWPPQRIRTLLDRRRRYPHSSGTG